LGVDRLRHFWIKTFQILSILLLIFLAVSTFIPQISEFAPGSYPGRANWIVNILHLNRFYNSPINLALWGLLSLIIIGGIIFNAIRSPIQQINHLLLALIFFIIIIEKSTNKRFNISIHEGQEIQFADYIGAASEHQNICLKLLRFEIQYHADQRTPKAFISHLLVNRQDTVSLAVNRPLAIDHYRLYQSAYDQHMLFRVIYDGKDYPVVFGDSVSVDNGYFILAGLDQRTHIFNLKVNGKYYHTNLQQTRRIENHSYIILPDGMRYTSIIEVAEVRWTKLLLILSILYLAGLFFAFWQSKSTK
jgi:hypothetical protein